MTSDVWKSFVPRIEHLVIVNYSTLNQVELVPLIGDENTLEATLRSKMVVIAHTFQEIEKAVDRINLL
jgi:hypothetical protein